jgi:hypothetical protein
MSFKMKNPYKSVIPVLISLELKLIVRNRKALNNFIQIIIIYLTLAVYYYFFSQTIPETSLLKLMIISLLSSIFILGHGLYLLTWESTYFGFLMTRKLSMNSFFLAKFFLFSLSGIILSIISIPLILLSKGNLFQYLSFLIFNVGVLPLIVVSVSFFNNERASLDKGIFFNYEGYGLWQYFVFLFEIMLPGLVFILLNIFWTDTYAYLLITIIGFFGIIIFLRKPILFFNHRKYKIIQGFNQR